MLFEDQLGGVFGDWSSGFSGSWQAQSDSSAKAPKRQQLEARANINRAKAETERHRRQLQSAIKARQRWANALPEQGDHKYLLDKGIRPYGCRTDGFFLIIPIYIDGTLANLQTITPNGEKRFQRGGSVKGGYFCIGDIGNTNELLICEGFATACTLHQESGLPVCVAFFAGNLKSAVMAIHKKYPNVIITVMGDNDHATSGNPGKKAAKEAAKAVGGNWLIPDFTGLNVGPKDTDFNDLARLSRLKSTS